MILSYITLRGSLARIHLSPGGTLVAISSLCSVIFVVCSFIFMEKLNPFGFSLGVVDHCIFMKV